MKKIALLCSCLLLPLLAHNARAAVDYWDPQLTSGSNPYTGSMTGTWENNDWSTSIAGTATGAAWANNDAADFGVNTGVGTPAFTVTMNANHTVAGAFVGATGLTPVATVTVNGTGKMTMLSGNLNGFNIGSSAFLTIDNVITGSSTAPICAESVGQLFLNGVNTYSGGSYLGFHGTSFGGIWNFNNSASFGTGGIYFSNCTGGAFVVEGSSAITIPNSFTQIQTNTASLNIVGNTAGVTFSGPWALSGAPGGTLLPTTPSVVGPVNIGSGAAANNLVTISGVISGTNSFTKYGIGILAFSATNTFSGPLSIGSGTLALTATGSVSNCSEIFINTNLVSITSGAASAGTFDVSAISSYVLSTNTLLVADGTGTTPGVNAAVIKGNATGSVSLGAQPVYLMLAPTSFTGDTTHPPLYISQGALVLDNNTITVSNSTATPLGAGTYTLIQVGDGSTGTITGMPDASAVVDGAGLAPGSAASVTISGSDVNLVVASATTPTTTVLTPPTAVMYGHALDIVATVSPDPSASGGAVQFFLNGSPMGSAVPVVSGGTATFTADPVINVGSASITASYSGSPDDAFQASKATAVTQGVNVTPLTITANAQSKTYGSALATGAGSTQFTSSGLQFGETIASVTLTCAGGVATAAVASSPYTETLSAAIGGSFNPANYSITYATNTMVVNQAALTITANAQVKTYGTTDPTGTGSTQFSSSGLKNSDTIGSVTLACSGAISNAAVSGSPYTETISAATGGSFNAANYSLSYQTNTMVVNPLGVHLTGTRIYDGTTNAAAGILTIGNIVGTDNLTLSGTAGLAGSAVGSEAITSFGALTLGGTSAGNYTLTGASGSVTITSAAFSITSANLDNTGANFIVTWQSTSGNTYHLVGSTNAGLIGSTNGSGTWTNVGSPIVASASSTSATNPITSPAQFIRVLSP